jgi:SpoVK/Ycf46/Vps4 family AAA+-type ATPase
MNYNFYNKLNKCHNSGLSHSVALCGNIYDLFFDGAKYVPLTQYLLAKTKTDNIIQVVYEINGPIRVVSGIEKLRAGWEAWRKVAKIDPPYWSELSIAEMINVAASKMKEPVDWAKDLDEKLSILGKPAASLEILRQLTICSRKYLKNSNLIIMIEGADMMLPAGDGDISRLNDAQLQRIAIMQDWLQDPDFVEGGDTVCLIAESASLLHSRVVRLPQIVTVEIASPDCDQRKHFIETYSGKPDDGLAINTAGLSLYALRQLLAEAVHDKKPLTSVEIIGKVESFIQSQVGEEVVEFKKPTHKMDDCVGNTELKAFLRNDVIPRMKGPKEAALSGAGVSGPIGGGKTFIFEALSGELDTPVLVIKNLRSQWYGQTDVIFERLRRVLEALEKVVIFVDEADTMFGSVSDDQATERRLTGKIQGMMSDPKLKGKVIWLLMTARIHLLSPDIRRPGRVGDLIIPVFDPEGEDRAAFVKWTVGNQFTDEQLGEFNTLTQDYSAASFASLRSLLKAKQLLAGKPNEFDDIRNTINDVIPSDIGKTRRYQELQALINCTRKSLLPKTMKEQNVKELREAWVKEIKALELEGIG